MCFAHLQLAELARDATTGSTSCSAAHSGGGAPAATAGPTAKDIASDVHICIMQLSSWLLPYCFTFRSFTITFTLANSHMLYPSAYPFTQQAMHQPQHPWIIAVAKRPSVVFV